MHRSWSAKGPAEIYAYSLDWVEELVDDEDIVGVIWSVLEGSVVLENPQTNGTITSITVTGGLDGEMCDIQCKVTTNSAPVAHEYTEVVKLPIRVQRV
jgi:hypothetical protein